MTNRYSAKLYAKADRLQSFEDNLFSIMQAIIESKENVIVSAIANDQLYRRGINGAGVRIKDYAPYHPMTIAIKQAKGQPTNRVTLRDTGAFHKSMYLVADSEGFYVDATDDKTELLENKYGDKIMTLTGDNIQRLLQSHVRKELLKRLKKALR